MHTDRRNCQGISYSYDILGVVWRLANIIIILFTTRDFRREYTLIKILYRRNRVVYNLPLLPEEQCLSSKISLIFLYIKEKYMNRHHNVYFIIKCIYLSWYDAAICEYQIFSTSRHITLSMLCLHFLAMHIVYWKCLFIMLQSNCQLIWQMTNWE